MPTAKIILPAGIYNYVLNGISGAVTVTEYIPPEPELPEIEETAIDAIFADGWSGAWSEVATQTTPETISNYDVEVIRKGFTPTGSPTNFVESVIVLGRKRLPWPDDETLTTDGIVLSEKVYLEDTISGAINDTVLQYPLPQTAWIDHDRQHVSGSLFTAKLAVAHAHGRNKMPVAAVKFILNDGVNPPLEQIVNTQATTGFPVTGLHVPHFEATFDVSGLQQGAIATLDAIIYPWVGNAYQLSVHGKPAPAMNCSTQQVMIDTDNSFGTAYAYVAIGASSGAVSSNAATARTTPFPTLAAAVAAVRTFNNTNYARNSSSGGVIRLEEGTHVLSKLNDGTASSSWLVPTIVEPAEGALKANTILRGPVASTTGSIPQMFKFKNLNIHKGGGNGGNYIEFDNGTTTAGSENMMIFEGCTFHLNGFQLTDTYIYRTGRAWFISCDGDYVGQTNPFSSVNKTAAIIGCGVNSLGSNYCHTLVLACRDDKTRLFFTGSNGLRDTRDGGMVGWNFISTDVGGSPPLYYDVETGPGGFAVVGNVFEGYGNYGGAICSVSADGRILPVENMNFMHNTLAGGRVNFMYNDAGTERVIKTGVYRCNVSHTYNTKSDNFGTPNGNRTGNWAILHKVGNTHNTVIQGAENEEGYSLESWMGPWAGVGNVSGTPSNPIEPNWLVDASSKNGGSGLGGGDYTPGPGTELVSIPEKFLSQSFDQRGRPMATSGFGYSGAIQPN